MSQNEMCRIYMEQAVEDIENLWFASCDETVFCRWNKNTGIVSKVCDLPIENIFIKRAYRAICRNGKYFVIAPWMGKPILAIYNCDTQDMTSIYLKDFCNTQKEINITLNFSKCIVYKKFVYITGLMYPAIVRLDLENFNIEYIDEWVKELDKIEQIPKGYYLAEGDVVQNIAYLPIACTNAILKLNLDTGNTKIIKLNTTLKNFNGLTAYENKLWLNGRYQGKLLSVDKDIKTIDEIYVSEDADIKRAALFAKPICVTGQILLLPVVAQHAYWINLDNGAVKLCEELEPYIQQTKQKCGKNSHCIFAVAYDNDKLYFTLLGNQSQYQYTFASNEVSKISVTCDRRLASQVILRRWNGFVRERESLNVEDFISTLMHTTKFSNISREVEKVDIGAGIYKTILGKGE